MAKVYQGKNSLQTKANLYLMISIILAIPLVLYILAFMVYRFHFEGIYHLLPVALFGWPSQWFFQRSKILRAGFSGEKGAMATLAQLPDGYSVFSGVQSEFDGKKGEIDFVVLGKNGLFAIEVKNHNGKIYVEENGEYWEQYKVGRRGGEYSKQFRNPLKQTGRNIYILSNWLKRQGIRVWIEGMVYFANDKVELDYLPQGCYISADELNRDIIDYSSKNKISPDDIKKIEALLQAGYK